MSNMSYCRFQNTLSDLRDCANHIDDILGEEEHEARLDLYDICKEIVDNCERKDLVELKEQD
jgi:hypothetical protein